MTTVGVAIPVPSPFGPQLDAARAATGDPQAPHVPAHVTLLGPTDIGSRTLTEVKSHLARAAGDSGPFDIHLRGTGTFRPITQVVFVAIAAGISECEKLETLVRSGPLAKELAYPYHPHVTVAQDVEPDALDQVFDDLSEFEARFHVPGFVLYTHDDGVWRKHREFTFGASARYDTMEP